MSTDPTSQVILPRVLLVIPVQEAVFDLADEQWEVKQPFGTHRFLPPGADFPFREPEVWVYTQLQGGLGPVEVVVEFRQRLDEDTDRVSYRSVGVSAAVRIDFERNESRLTIRETVFGFSLLPFREEGTYEFRLLAVLAGGGTVPLSGVTCDLSMLHPERRV